MRDLPPRSTRGRRLRALLDDEEDADEEFWAQDFFQEDAKDAEYDAVGEVDEDVFDSDFADTSSEEEGSEEGRRRDLQDGEDELEAERRKRRKRTRPGSEKGKVHVPKRRTDAEVQAAQAKREALKRRREQELGHRKSVRSVVVEKDLERLEQKEREAEEARKQPHKTSKPTVEDQPLRQEDLIREAVITEMENRRKLQQLLTREEETKKKANVQKVKFKGPGIKLHSKRDGTTITFSHVDQVPAILRQHTAPLETKPTQCAVTGTPARYKDPWTGKPYATIEAFRTLRSSSDQYIQRGLQKGTTAGAHAHRKIEDILFPSDGMRKGKRTRPSCHRATLARLVPGNEVGASRPT